MRTLKVEEIIAAETKRINELYGKSFLDCEELIQLTGVGRDNTRALMKSKAFPVVKVSNRQVVSVVNFVPWQISTYLKGDNSDG